MLLTSKDIIRLKELSKNKSQEIELSLDLNKTKTIVKLENNQLILPNNQSLNLSEIKTPKGKSCYLIKNSKLQKFQFFSQETNQLYKLIPTEQKPLLQISGTSMHKKEFVDLIKTNRLNGIILDSGTGLGYTAIEASKTAKEVITIEIDSNITKIQKINPWSQELFNNPKIKLIQGDLAIEIKKYNPDYFDNIIQDTGQFKRTGELFSKMHYKEVLRTLKPSGTFYNYIPNPKIKTTDKKLHHEIIIRLKETGFINLKYNPISSSIIGRKKINHY